MRQQSYLLMAAVRHPGFQKFAVFCHVTFVGMPFCFLVQNLAEIAQSVDELRVKKAIFEMAAVAILNLNFWSQDCHRVQYLL